MNSHIDVDAQTQTPHSDGSQDIAEEVAPVTAPRPRLLVNRRNLNRAKKNEGDDIMSIVKAQLLQEGLHREEELQARDEERFLHRERQEQEAKRHERFMDMMTLIMCRGLPNKDIPETE